MKPIERIFGVKDICPHCYLDDGEYRCERYKIAYDRWSCETNPCYVSDWEQCDYNKPEPVREWQWILKYGESDYGMSFHAISEQELKDSGYIAEIIRPYHPSERIRE